MLLNSIVYTSYLGDTTSSKRNSPLLALSSLLAISDPVSLMMISRIQALIVKGTKLSSPLITDIQWPGYPSCNYQACNGSFWLPMLELFKISPIPWKVKSCLYAVMQCGIITLHTCSKDDVIGFVVLPTEITRSWDVGMRACMHEIIFCTTEWWKTSFCLLQIA